MLVFWLAAAVFVVVEGGILLISIRYRHRKDRDRMPPQIHGNTRLEIGWTIAPGGRPGVRHGSDGRDDLGPGASAGPSALHVTVKGYQWWWGFQYTDPT